MPRPKFMRADVPAMRANRTAFERRVIYTTDPKMVEALGYLAAHCLQACRLEVFALTLFFNHGHYDLGHPPEDADPETRARFSDFYEMFHWWVYRLLTRNGWEHGPTFTPRERTHDAPSLDADKLLDNLVYDMAQAVKAGLFRRSADYPGLCLLPENVTTPRIFERNSLIADLDPDGTIFREDKLSIQLGVPSIFAHLGRERYQEVLQKRLDAYEAEHANPRADKQRGLKACSAATLGKQFDKHLARLRTRGKIPASSTPGPPPPYTSKPELRRAYMEQRRNFWDQHSASASQIKSGETGVVFPAGTYGRSKTLNVAIACVEVACWTDQPTWWPD